MVCSGRGQEGQVDTDWSCIPPRECVCPFSWGGGGGVDSFPVFFSCFALFGLNAASEQYTRTGCVFDCKAHTHVHVHPMNGACDRYRYCTCTCNNRMPLSLAAHVHVYATLSLGLQPPGTLTQCVHSTYKKHFLEQT